MNKRKVEKLREVLGELREMQERAWISVLALSEYFSLTEEAEILEGQDRARVQCDIAHDYIFRVGEWASVASLVLEGDEKNGEG